MKNILSISLALTFLIGTMVLISQPAHGALTTNCKYTTQVDVTTSTTSTQGLANDAMRKCLVLTNKDAAITVYVKFITAHSGTEGIWLLGNTRIEFQNVPIGAIFFKSASGAPVVGIMSGN